MVDFDAVYMQYGKFIYKFLFKYCHDELLTEELVQETFFRAYINIASVRNEDCIPSWLCAVAKNVYYSWYNKNKKQRATDHPETGVTAETPEDTVVIAELKHEAMKCLNEMEEPYREVMMLYIFGQMSLKDISISFGKSESWARVTFYRAKQKLRMKFSGNEVF